MKYKLVEKKFFPELDRELWQIEAVDYFVGAKKGERGGWIEKEDNLSQYGNAWVSDNARVYDNAWVYGDAWVGDNAVVSDTAEVYGCAIVSGSAWVYGNAMVCDNAWVGGDTQVYGATRVSGNAEVSNSKEILFLGKLGNWGRFITCTPDRSRKMQIACGCFLGGIDDFEKAVRAKYGDDLNSDYMLIMPLLRKKEAEWAK